MKITTKSLRTRAKEILDCVDRGEPVTITYRGKPRARLLGIDHEKKVATGDDSAAMPVFGMWQDREDLPNAETYVRLIRKSRSIDH